jgi:hypothetical protein
MKVVQSDLRRRVVEHGIVLYENGWHLQARIFCEASLALGLGSPVLQLVYSLAQAALNNKDAAEEALAKFDAALDDAPESAAQALRQAREHVLPYLPGNARSVSARQRLRAEAVRFLPRLAAEVPSP